VVQFGSILHARTRNAKVVSFLNLYTLNPIIKKLYNFDSLKMKNQWSILIIKREAPGIFPVCPMVNPALPMRSYIGVSVHFISNKKLHNVMLRLQTIQKPSHHKA